MAALGINWNNPARWKPDVWDYANARLRQDFLPQLNELGWNDDRKQYYIAGFLKGFAEKMELPYVNGNDVEDNDYAEGTQGGYMERIQYDKRTSQEEDEEQIEQITMARGGFRRAAYRRGF